MMYKQFKKQNELLERIAVALEAMVPPTVIIPKDSGPFIYPVKKKEGL